MTKTPSNNETFIVNIKNSNRESSKSSTHMKSLTIETLDKNKPKESETVSNLNEHHEGSGDMSVEQSQDAKSIILTASCNFLDFNNLMY